MTIQDYRQRAENGLLNRKMRKCLARMIKRKYDTIERIQDEIQEIDGILTLNLANKENSKIIIDFSVEIIL